VARSSFRSGKGSGCAQIGLGGRLWGFETLLCSERMMRSRSRGKAVVQITARCHFTC